MSLPQVKRKLADPVIRRVKKNNASRTTEELTVALKEQIDQGLMKSKKEMVKFLLRLGREELSRQVLQI